ncbi:glutamine amidotransferase [Mesorhizobium sp. B2-3-14]|uniref:glutamine amidotransferase-related protein n=1 Tax=unclassified Mesorhizobium TaxID=325217 RepID=UPI001126EB68|nr:MULTISPECIES: glutamine amidotransferase [unclassified Mesorhizobium]TPK79516.1 glutamine amidotransferase [Mesorhizobium sp. B2-4-18]TPL74992.1 glutamine amidotransferase [Mesorhizobium sp. B2-3-15]TPL87737.1 glutamine amidotransferase [Mesorhizobium sp. B2-3-14]TPL97518.1 glutamine amidotransferase [Mesorhizobium sp. B2-3-10]
MKRRIILVRHGDEPADDRVFAYLQQSGYQPVLRRAYAGEALEADEDVAGGVVYGGMYNVYDTSLHPFLVNEYRFIDFCMSSDIPLLGICQGAQQIAWHRGAHVGPPVSGVHEFGCYPLYPTAGAEDFLSEPIHVTQSHWHGFDLPEGAQHLASSASFPNQAFRIGDKIYGLQFHAEVTRTGFRRVQDRPTANYDKPGAQTREEQDRLMSLHDAAQAAWFNGFLRKLFPPLI